MCLRSIPNGSYRLPNELLIMLYSVTLIHVPYSTFLSYGAYVPGASKSFLMVSHSLKDIWIPILLQMFFFLKLSPNPLIYGITMWMLLSLLWLFVVCSYDCCCYSCNSFLSQACLVPHWEIALFKGPLVCSSSFSSICGLAQKVLALFVRVLYTLYWQKDCGHYPS